MEANMEIMNDLETGFQSEIDIRKGKLKKMNIFGETPYKEKYEKSHSLQQVSSLPEGTNVSICRRVITKRAFGKFMCMNIYDIEHTQQISVSVNEFGDENYQYIASMIDIADFIGAKGTLYYTKTGELTVNVSDFTLSRKALKPLPEKWPRECRFKISEAVFRFNLK